MGKSGRGAKTFAVIVFTLFSIPAFADMRVNLKYNFPERYGTTCGGEFLMTVLDDPVGVYSKNDQFTTFCLETNEYIDQNHNYYVTIGSAAMNGGTGGGSPDLLSPEAAYLYSLWLDGTDGVNTIVHGTATTDALQRALWYLEGENLGSNSGLSGTYISWAQDAVSPGGANDSWCDKWGYTIGDIRVMNMWWNPEHTSYAQDQFVRVPLPAAVLLGLLGLSAAGLKLRKSI